MQPTTEQERTWGLIAHLSALAGLLVPPIGHVLGPLVVWLVKREKSAFVADQAREALNFNITMTLVGIACVILAFILIGFFAGVIAGLYWLVMVIVAGVKANEGVSYRYPFALRLVK